MSNIIYKRVETERELLQILEIQRANVKLLLSDEVIKTEGFVSVKHTFDVLKRMNDACPHIIATHKEKVVGYALCMLNAFRNDVPTLIPMFEYMDGIIESKKLSKLHYLIMGQICIDKAYRKQGIFKKMYQYFKDELKSDFDAVVTEVNSKNARSSKAHQAVGFNILDVHTEEGEDWELMIWKWA
ncbi:GNAT family N-acetyltransferase [Flavivirga algicola]|uniref:GNAT family N-acetyltransferase n=1 Tax=Flavivirga algicola TaxID=2729136 RepID=A0ABX1RYL5_9FLAO|nr:GNAT family N-acetyltransferase [Flavivirga algicola]NMH87430.1 GNAT family N-acetyltransferase [Flavivirga algicola]